MLIILGGTTVTNRRALKRGLVCRPIIRYLLCGDKNNKSPPQAGCMSRQGEGGVN